MEHRMKGAVFLTLLIVCCTIAAGAFTFGKITQAHASQGTGTVAVKPTQQPIHPKPTQQPIQPKPTQQPIHPKPTQQPIQPKPTQQPIQPKPTQQPIRPKPTPRPKVNS